MHADQTAGDDVDASPSDSVPDVAKLLQRLQLLELRADLDAQIIAQLRDQNKVLEADFNAESSCGEKHAEALTGIQRTCDSFMRICDNRVNELSLQHARAIAKLEDAAAANKRTLETLRAENAALKGEMTALKAAAATAVAKVEKEKAALEGQVALLQAQATSKLTDIHTVVAALQGLLPPRPFLSLAPVAFDRDWCAAACGTKWDVDIDAGTSLRAHVTGGQYGDTDPQGYCCLTLRGAAPLPHRPSSSLVVGGRKLPGYRVVVEAYGVHQSCRFGFIPSHHAGAAVTPLTGRNIFMYGGWCILVGASPDDRSLMDGWSALQPAGGGYATTSKTPRVPPGSALEFAVDYDAGTCCVAFYTPEAVVGGFAEAPYAQMELRFDAAGAGARARPVIDSQMALYPAATIYDAGAILRFAS
jgi:hypothetical protein